MVISFYFRMYSFGFSFKLKNYKKIEKNISQIFYKYKVIYLNNFKLYKDIILNDTLSLKSKPQTYTVSLPFTVGHLFQERVLSRNMMFPSGQLCCCLPASGLNARQDTFKRTLNWYVEQVFKSLSAGGNRSDMWKTRDDLPCVQAVAIINLTCCT